MKKSRRKNQNTGIPIYRADGRAVVGRVEGDTFYKRVRSTVHKLRRPPAWACDVESLDQAAAAGATRVEIFDGDTGRTCAAAIDDFYQHGIKVSRGHGVQLALPMSFWSIVGRVEGATVAPQAAAAGPSQLRLFEGVPG